MGRGGKLLGREERGKWSGGYYIRTCVSLLQGVKAEQQEAAAKSLEARLQASEQTTELIKTFSSPQVRLQLSATLICHSIGSPTLSPPLIPSPFHPSPPPLPLLSSLSPPPLQPSPPPFIPLSTSSPTLSPSSHPSLPPLIPLPLLSSLSPPPLIPLSTSSPTFSPSFHPSLHLLSNPLPLLSSLSPLLSSLSPPPLIPLSTSSHPSLPLLSSLSPPPLIPLSSFHPSLPLVPSLFHPSLFPQVSLPFVVNTRTVTKIKHSPQQQRPPRPPPPVLDLDGDSTPTGGSDSEDSKRLGNSSSDSSQVREYILQDRMQDMQWLCPSYLLCLEYCMIHWSA